MCSQSGDHPENHLAKFVYILDMKSKEPKNKESFFIIGYLLELLMKIWQKKFKSSKYGEFGHYFHEKSFV